MPDTWTTISLCSFHLLMSEFLLIGDWDAPGIHCTLNMDGIHWQLAWAWLNRNCFPTTMASPSNYIYLSKKRYEKNSVFKFGYHYHLMRSSRVIGVLHKYIAASAQKIHIFSNIKKSFKAQYLHFNVNLCTSKNTHMKNHVPPPWHKQHRDHPNGGGVAKLNSLNI